MLWNECYVKCIPSHPSFKQRNLMHGRYPWFALDIIIWRTLASCRIFNSTRHWSNYLTPCNLIGFHPILSWSDIAIEMWADAKLFSTIRMQRNENVGWIRGIFLQTGCFAMDPNVTYDTKQCNFSFDIPVQHRTIHILNSKRLMYHFN